MAIPPFNIDETKPAATDNISAYPAVEQLFRDVVESWLTFISDPATGLIKDSAFPVSPTFTNINYTGLLTGTSVDPGAGVGPVVLLYRDSPSPAASDVIGGIRWDGETSTSARIDYGYHNLRITNPTNGAVSSQHAFFARSGGTLVEAATLDGNSLTVNGVIQFGQYILSTTTAAVLAATGVGAVYLRPNGFAATAGQAILNTSGDFSLVSGAALSWNANNVTLTHSNDLLTLNKSLAVSRSVSVGPGVGSSFSQSTGVTDLFSMASGSGIQMLPGGTGTYMQYYGNGNFTAAGRITLSVGGTQTNYITTSDERLKDFIGEFDGVEALDIIRRDPVRKWNWKDTTADGDTPTVHVGWGAQTSYNVSHDLAHPGEEPDDAWGVDKGARTPYLWAAVDYLDDRLSAIEKKLGV